MELNNWNQWARFVSSIVLGTASILKLLMILGQHYNTLTPQVPEMTIGSENQPTPGSGEVSNNKFDHINNNHNYNKLIEQIERRLAKSHIIEQMFKTSNLTQ